MYIVIFEERDGYFGPFETRSDGENYILAIDSRVQTTGRVVSLVKPYALGRINDV